LSWTVIVRLNAGLLTDNRRRSRYRVAVCVIVV